VNTSAVSSGIAAALVVALAITGAAAGRTQATAIKLNANMNAAQEVPATTGDVSAARGKFSATVTATETGGSIAWQLTFGGTSGAVTAAHIHIGAPGVAGGVAVPLCGPCVSPASGTANVDASVLSAIQTGGAYANAHTATNKPGEIRGQIGVLASVTTALNARQGVPKAKGSVGDARGTFAATITKTGTTAKIGWRLTFSGLTGKAAAAHIHTGQRGKAGPVAVALCGPCRSGMRRSTALSPAVLSALEAGRAYVNIHTARNAAGEVRSQIAAVPLRITG